MKARIKVALVTVLMTISTAGGLLVNAVTTAAPAQAAQYVTSMALVINGQSAGILQVEYDGYGMASYMFHKNSTLYVPRWTQAHFCYTYGPNGWCLERPGYDGGVYGSWAGPAAPWPNNAKDEYGQWRPWRATGTIRDQYGHDWQAVIISYGLYDNNADRWIQAGRVN